MAPEIKGEIKRSVLNFLTREFYRVEKSEMSEKKKAEQILSLFEIFDFCEGLKKPKKEQFSHIVV